MRISDWSSDVCSSDLSTTVAGYWLPPHVATFVQRFPGVGFELQVGNTAGIGHAIAAGRIDVAFVEGVVDDPGIVATPWRDEPLQVAVAADAKLGAKRSEEHTSELQSHMGTSYAVFCLKKKVHTISENHSATMTEHKQ